MTKRFPTVEEFKEQHPDATPREVATHKTLYEGIGRNFNAEQEGAENFKNIGGTGGYCSL